MPFDRPFITLRLDHAGEARVSEAQVNEKGRPFVFVSVCPELSLYTHEPARLRQLAQLLTTAAEMLDAKATPAETVTT